MKLIELIERIPKPRGKKNLVLACLYFLQHVENREIIQAKDILHVLKKQVRTSSVERADVVLRACGAKVYQNPDSSWILTETGKESIEEILGISSVLTEVKVKIENLLPQIIDADDRKYIEESVKCLKVSALRGAVVMGWIATIQNICKKIERYKDDKNPQAKGLDVFINTYRRKHLKAKSVADAKELSEEIKDSEILAACLEMRIFDKSEYKNLSQALSLRNDCGHPANYFPEEHKVNAFYEDVIKIVLSK